MKHLLPLLLILINLSSFSQNFVQDNKQWNVISSSWGSEFTEFFFTSGDTLIEGEIYAKLFRSNDSLETSFYHGAFREENNRVIYISRWGDEGLLYDFNLNAGDSTYIITDFVFGTHQLLVIVDSVNYVEFEGVQRKVLYIHEKDMSIDMEEYWIEGIGSTNGPVYTFIYNHIVCIGWHLSCCYEEGVQIFQHTYLDCYANDVGIEEIENNQVLISPNPLNGDYLLKIQMNDNIRISSIDCFDLSGKKILSEQVGFSTQQTLDLSDLAKGSYILKITSSENREFVKKLIIQ